MTFLEGARAKSLARTVMKPDSRTRTPEADELAASECQVDSTPAAD